VATPHKQILQQQDQGIIADAHKHVRLPCGLPAEGSVGLFSASPRVTVCSLCKLELLLLEAELLLRLLSESNSESLSCEDSRSPQLASQGWGSLASALRLGVVGAAGCGEGLEAGRSGVSTKADSCKVTYLSATISWVKYNLHGAAFHCQWHCT